MKKVIFRCDASHAIGSGHVMRCRTLARELQRNNFEAIFLCRRQPGDLIALLEDEFLVLILPEQKLSPSNGLEGRALYDAWLGCRQAQDANESLTALTTNKVLKFDWIVVDHYGIDITWELHFRKGLIAEEKPKVLVIDDLADRRHTADILLDQNYFGSETRKRYKKLIPSNCYELLGPHYALIGSEYTQLRPITPERRELRRILVFFGGVDKENLTGKTLEALMDPNLEHLAVDVILGSQSPHRKEVKKIVEQRRFTTMHEQLPTLAGLMARADLAIGAGGCTTWERECLKLPSLVVAIADNQVAFTENLQKAGHLEFLGDARNLDVQQIHAAILNQIINFKEKDVKHDLTDGYGAYRVAMAMLTPDSNIKLRLTTKEDEALLKHWAADAEAQSTEGKKERLTRSEHHQWLTNCLADSDQFLMIVTAGDGCPIGQIQLIRKKPLTKEGAYEVIVKLLLDHCIRNKGVTDTIIKEGLQAMEQKWGVKKESRLNPYISSKACFARLSEKPSDSTFKTLDTTSKKSKRMKRGRITILSDKDSWLNNYITDLILALSRRGHSVRWIHSPSQLAEGEVCMLLSCGRILSADELAMHQHNLVVHGSALPKGQGWSPVTWQILEGTNQIPITIFEAESELDTGAIYIQDQIELKGNELADDWRFSLAQATIKICLDWVDHYKDIAGKAKPQTGETSHYSRRRPADSEINPGLPMTEQFNLLRVVDNKNYPAFFKMKGNKYIIKIYLDQKLEP